MLRNLILIFALLVPATANASVVAVFTENSSDVVLDVSGSLDLSALGNNTNSGTMIGGTSISGGGFRIGATYTYDAVTYFVNNYFVPFATSVNYGTYLSGMNFAFDNNGPVDQVRVPTSYVSGTSFTSSASFAGSFASLGLSGNNVTMHLPGDQTLSVQFVPISTVPLPAAGLLMLTGLGGLLAMRRMGKARRGPAPA